MRGLFASTTESRPTPDEIRERRIEMARRNSGWAELHEAGLVHRGPFLVHADSDEVYVPYRGTAFQHGSADIIADRFPMSWFLDRDGCHRAHRASAGDVERDHRAARAQEGFAALTVVAILRAAPVATMAELIEPQTVRHHEMYAAGAFRVMPNLELSDIPVCVDHVKDAAPIGRVVVSVEVV